MKKTPRQFRVSDAVHAQVQRLAASADLSVSAVLRVLVIEGLKRRGMWPASSTSAQRDTTALV